MLRLCFRLAVAGLLACAAPFLAVAAEEPPPPAQASSEPVTKPALAPLAAAPAKPKPEATLTIDIDLTRQRMTVSEYGSQIGSWAISSGAEGHRSPTGTYRPLWLARMWYSKKYDNAPMPHAVFFSGGVALHATQSVGMLGHPASHGCIRQSPANAATTYRLVEKHGNAHTRIFVHGSPHDDEPRMARKSPPIGYGQALVRPNPYRVEPARRTYSQASVGMRRVILVDGDGNRRIAAIPSNDPRLMAYQRRNSGLE